jgi:PKD repeat protein
MGGTQDNGTPFFRFDGTSATPFTDVSLGDGTYAYFGDDFAYTSSQFGNVNRVRYVNGVPDFNMNNINRIKPMGATKQLFVNPFVVDPSNEEIMYYPAGNILWRNDQLSSIPDDQNGTSIGWSELPNVSFSDGYSITALEVSKSNPMHQLYYGASGREKVPKIYKLPNANTATNNPIDVSVPNVPAGSYLHNIAVNPDDGNEVIMLFSNYNIEGLYHSTDGGESYTSIEGNLTGNEEDPGPSLRGVEIVPSDNGTMYFVGTSIGVFSTSKLNGLNTIWSQEGEEIIGNVIVNYISSRKSDGKVIAGTHGRGAFVTNVGGTGLPLIFADSEEMQIDCLPDSSANSFLTISNNGGGNLNYSITASGSFGDKFVSAVNSEKFEIADKSSSPVNISSVNADVAFAPNYNITGTDVLLLDDGDDSPDTFVGFEDMYGFAAVNEFLADGFDYTVEQIAFYARSENALTNSFYAAVCDGELNKLWESYENFDLSSNGKWFTIDISNPVKFDNGENFYLVVQSYFSFVLYPFGYDTLAQVTDHSYYVDPYDDTKLINVNTVPGLDKGAFLIRAIGTKGTAANEEPVAVATISNSNPIVGETVTFDASQSYDNDGQITAYLWDFGDGTTSNQKIATHAYSAANTYQFTLTVTDNTNATGYTQGQIVVTEEENQAPVAVASVSKNVAEINESISFDASQSYDDDGQIISYLWDFGDGNTSTEVNTTHSYSAADTYTFTLTVTDNEDASDQISGEIMITDSNYVQRLIVTPSSGTLSGGESETIRIDFFSEGLAEGNYVGEVNITSNGGNKTIPLNIRVDKTVNVEEIVQNSYDYKLEQNYPNPFNPITRIEFQIPQRENVEIKIYDITGREVTTLINEVKNPGTYSVSFDGSKYASGVYFYRIKTGEYISSRKLVLLK